MLGQLKFAIKDYNEAIRLKPDYGFPFNNKGLAYLIQGNKISGCRDLQKSCELGDCQFLKWARSNEECL